MSNQNIRTVVQPAEADCRSRMQPLLDAFLLAVTSVESAPGDLAAEKRLCLESRSAYFVFFDWAIIYEKLDDSVVAEMQSLFAKSLRVLKDNRYRESGK